MPPLRVAVIGGLNMDLVVRAPRLPRPGETVTGEDLLRAPGGKGANQAVAAARLGASVTMIGRVGHDEFGRELSRHLRDDGVSTSYLLGSDRPTGAALIVVDERGENSIAVAPGANQALLPEDVPRRAIEGVDVVLAPLEVPLATIEEAFRVARLAGVRTVLNCALAQTVPRSLLALSDVLVCNEVELGTMLGTRTSGSIGGEASMAGESAIDRGAATGGEADVAREFRTFDSQVVVVTLGERGALAVTGADVVSQAAFAVHVVDTTGAGDAFAAGFVVGRWFDAGVAAALRLACAAGALAATVRGAQPSMPRLIDVMALLKSD